MPDSYCQPFAHHACDATRCDVLGRDLVNHHGESSTSPDGGHYWDRPERGGTKLLTLIAEGKPSHLKSFMVSDVVLEADNKLLDIPIHAGTEKREAKQ